MSRSFKSSLLLIVLFVSMWALDAQEAAPISEALLVRYIEDFHNQQNEDVADEILAPDFRLHMAKGRELDVEGVKGLFRSFWRSSSRPEWTLQTVITGEELVAGTYTWQAGNFKIAGVTVLRTDAGRIAEGWDIWDTSYLGRSFREVRLDLGGDTAETNSAIVRSLLTDWPSINEDSFAGNFTLYLPQSQFGEEPLDRVEAGEWASELLVSFPDLNLLPYADREDFIMVAEGDLVAVVHDIEGTFENAYGGMPFNLQPNRNEIRFTAITLIRLDDGEISDIWLYWDTDALLSELMARSVTGSD